MDRSLEATNGKSLFGGPTSMISVVIPNYNGEVLLKKNLPKLLDLLHKSKLDFEIIVVDDASIDESRTVLEPFARGGLAHVVYKPQNDGFPATAHRGFLEAKGEFVFVIKNDAVPEKADYFQLLIDHFKDSKVFAVGAGQKTIENGKEEIRGSGVIYWNKGFFLHKRGDGKSFTAWADGGSSAFRKDLYFKIGGFDPVFRPGYWEDVDLGYRAWKAGYKVTFEPKAILVHNFEQGSFKKKYGSEKIRKVSLRNQFIFTWKNSDLKHLILSFVYEPYNHLAAIKRGEWDFVGIYWWAFLKWPKIFLARIKQKGLTKFSDDEVLKKFTEFLR